MAEHGRSLGLSLEEALREQPLRRSPLGAAATEACWQHLRRERGRERGLREEHARGAEVCASCSSRRGPTEQVTSHVAGFGEAVKRP